MGAGAGAGAGVQDDLRSVPFPIHDRDGFTSVFVSRSCSSIPLFLCLFFLSMFHRTGLVLALVRN